MIETPPIVLTSTPKKRQEITNGQPSSPSAQTFLGPER